MNNYDFLLIILSAMMHAGWNFYAKKSKADKIATLWLGWMIAGFLSLPFAIYFTDMTQASWKWVPYLILTGIIHAFYLYYLGLCYAKGEMSVIYPISRGFGIFLTICIVYFFEIEDVSDKGLLGVMILIIGIVGIAVRRLRDVEKRLIMKLAIKAGFCTSLYSLIDKFSVAVIPPLFYISIMFCVTPLILSPLMLGRLKSQTLHATKHNVLYSGGIGLVSFFTYLLILIAMTETLASYVVALREVSIVFGSILGITLLKEEKSFRKTAGILMIMIGAYVIKTS